MLRQLFAAAAAALALAAAPAAADQHTRKAKAEAKKEKKAEGASCKAPAVGACASCAITCRPGETATCGPGMLSGDLCARPPSCACK